MRALLQKANLFPQPVSWTQALVMQPSGEGTQKRIDGLQKTLYYMVPIQK